MKLSSQLGEVMPKILQPVYLENQTSELCETHAEPLVLPKPPIFMYSPTAHVTFLCKLRTICNILKCFPHINWNLPCFVSSFQSYLKNISQRLNFFFSRKKYQNTYKKEEQTGKQLSGIICNFKKIPECLKTWTFFSWVQLKYIALSPA